MQFRRLVYEFEPRAWLIAICLATSTYCCAVGQELPIDAAAPVTNRVKLTLEYHFASAQKVDLVWGVNNWQPLPPDAWPAGTFLSQRVMNTPLKKVGDKFVAELVVASGSSVEFGFMTTQFADQACSAWETGPDGAFKITPLGDTTEVIESKLTRVGPNQELLAVQHISYALVGAGKVSLLWSVDDPTKVIETMLPSGTVREENYWTTPLEHHEGLFSTDLALPVGTNVKFAFHITELLDGRSTDQYDGELTGEQHYQFTAALGNRQVVEVDTSVLDSLLSDYFGISYLGWLIIVALAIAMPFAVTLKFRLLRALFAKITAQIDTAPTLYNLSAKTIFAIVWLPVVLTFGVSAYLTLGFLESPFLAQIRQPRFVTGSWNDYVFWENGPIELLTFIFLLAGGMLGLAASRTAWKNKLYYASAFYACFALGLCLVAMEEIAWGQKFVDFQTPAWFSEHNAQGELTLHNIEDVHGYSATVMQLVFGLGGLVGIGFALRGWLKPIAAPPILLLWFLIISAHAGLYVANDLHQINKYFDWWIRQLVEFVEMLIALAAFLYIWLNRRKLRREENS